VQPECNTELEALILKNNKIMSLAPLKPLKKLIAANPNLTDFHALLDEIDAKIANY
jgi:hypothetical protein